MYKVSLKLPEAVPDNFFKNFDQNQNNIDQNVREVLDCHSRVKQSLLKNIKDDNRERIEFLLKRF